ncbi:MAG: aminotransferase class III-fold pyridoxal phosphate-dependent enzyme [Rhodobacteraceae bacterium]|jgi:adenosylmethionine-8-amino-7-oxononanoate aminotransferase|nr:aminotransferase class III-fold pyridoxal phosphate-dependent enzyme [Paracoccaceae bacterium]
MLKRTGDAPLRDLARRRLRHFLADFARLEDEFPGRYPHVIVRGEGPYVIDDAGHRLLDAGNHLGACNIGHGRAEVARAMGEQAARLEFSALDSGNSHDAAIRFADRLAGMLPMEDACISFCGSGSEGNELAYKIARAWHFLRGEPGRLKILSRAGSYHGSSYGAMAATGIDAFGAGFGPLAPAFVRIPQPSHDRCPYCANDTACTLACIEATRAIVRAEGPGTIAAIVAEPLAIPQAVKVPPPGYWQALAEIAREAGALLIVDEVVTGFGRTGRMFGCDHWGVRPDIMVMAKGISSGYVPLGAVATSARVNAAFADKPLLHLNTFAGHPVACAAGEAVLDILEREDLVGNAARLEPILRARLEAIAAQVPEVLRVTVIGLMASVEVDASACPDLARLIRRVRHEAYGEGLLVRVNPDGTRATAFFYPSLNVTEDDILRGAAALGRAFRTALDAERGGRRP